MPILLPKNAQMFTLHCGEATFEDGRSYDLTTCMNSGAPVIRANGRLIRWTWDELLEQAIELYEKETGSAATDDGPKDNNSPSV